MAAPKYQGVGESPHVCHSHIHVGLEAACAQDNAATGVYIKILLRALHPAPDYVTPGIHDELPRRRLIGKSNTHSLRTAAEGLYQPFTSGFRRPTITRGMRITHLPLDSPVSEPLHRIGCILNYHLDQLWVSPAPGDTHEIVPVIVLSIVPGVELVMGVRVADLSIGELGVATSILDGRFLDENDLGALLSSGNGCGKSGDASPGYKYVTVHSSYLPFDYIRVFYH